MHGGGVTQAFIRLLSNVFQFSFKLFSILIHLINFSWLSVLMEIFKYSKMLTYVLLHYDTSRYKSIRKDPLQYDKMHCVRVQ